MAELLGPTFIFDARIGEAVAEIDIDRDVVTALMRDRLSDEALNETVIEFAAGAKENPSADDEWAEASRRRIVFYLGSYVTGALAEEPSPYGASVTVGISLSLTMAHEIEHLRQFETGAIPAVWLGELPPYAERPWERQAIKAEDAYIAARRRRERGWVASVDLK